MFIPLSLQQALAIVKKQSLTERAAENLQQSSLDLGVCAVSKIPLSDSPKYLYFESFDKGCGVADSLANWIDTEWSDPSSEYCCGEF